MSPIFHNSGKNHWKSFDVPFWFSSMYTFTQTHAPKNIGYWGFPGGAVVENLPANAGDTGSSPGLGRSHMPRSN